MVSAELGSVLMRAAVLGQPIAHSKSPALHRAAYQALGLDWTYDAIEVGQEDLADFLAGLDATWAGLSLTMPLKETVLGYLDSRSELVAVTESANTVLFTETGRRGENTDVYGMVAAIRAADPKFKPQSASIVGGGATARSAIAALADLGASSVRVSARRPVAAAAVVAVGERVGLAVEAVPWESYQSLLSADLVICTLPADAAAALADAVPTNPGALLDVTYHPWPTTLAARWGEAGGLVVGGSAMLLWQAARQVELMTGRAAPVAAMAAAL